MRTSRFIWKIYIGFSIVILISSLTLGLLVTKWIEKDSLEEIKKELQSQALMFGSIADQAASADHARIQNYAKNLGSSIGTRFTLIDFDGVVIADSREDPSSMDNHANRPEILSARSHGEGSSVRLSDTIGDRMMYYAIPVPHEGSATRYVRTSISLETIDGKISRLRQTVMLGSGIAIIVALILGYYLANNISRPIESMTHAAETMSMGNYEEKLPENRNDEIGKLARTLNSMADNLKERIEAVNGEKNKLEAILAGMVEGVIAVDKDERILLINKAACSITGAMMGKSIGLPVWEAVSLQGLGEILATTLEDKSEVKQEIVVIRKEGARHIEVISAPTFITEDELSGAVVVLHDITELNSLERIRRDFVANVSHELKTPIAAIRAMIETIVDDKQMSKEDRVSFLEKIKKQSIRLSMLVTDVLTIASIESDKKPTDTQLLDLGAVVHDVYLSLTTESETRKIELKVKTPEAPVKINGDEEELTQAIGNLVDNALKHTPGGGYVHVRLKTSGASAIVEVEDTGIGIEPVHQQRIFERFYRVDKARSRELGGTGLGLSIVKHVALSHGGKVEVESAPGTGSIFRMTLPLASS